MIRLFPARFFSMITLMIIGWSNVVFAQPVNNYCMPSLVKENIFFEKLQIGTWVPSLTTGSKVASINTSIFGAVDQNYEFSLKGMPQTRDTFYWQIWIDFNQDNDFADGGELFLSTFTSRNQKALGKIHFPSTIQGQYLVRIMLSRSKANNACGTQSKALDYLDFWLKGACPDPNPTAQVKVVDSTQESILLRFNWPKNTKFNWVLSGKEGVSYSKYGSDVGDTLLIKYLYFENTYQFKYQLQCGELVWSNWSDPVDMGTVYKPTCSQIDINQVKIDEVGFDHVTITVPKQENSDFYWIAAFSYDGKGDTVYERRPYGQSKIPLRLSGAKYYLSLEKVCLNGYSSEWTFNNLTFTTLPDPCASVFLKINRLGANSFVQAFPTKKIAYEWRLRLKGNVEWQVSESIDDTLSLSTLDNSSVYEIQVRVKCTPESWSEWSILQNFSLSNACPKPQLADIEYQQEGMLFKLSYQGTPYRKVIWDNPASLQQCIPTRDSTKPELSLWIKYGEKLYVRIKGVCKENNEQSDYSDTLWLERPCVAPGLADFNAVNISDKTMDFLVNAEFCGDYDYLFSQDSLSPNSAWKSFSYRKYPRGNFTALQPSTKYFIKIRRQCYDRQAQSVYSPIKSFVTLSQPKECQAKAIPKNDIKIEFAEPSTVIIRIKPQNANSHYRVYMSKYDEYVGYFYNAEFRDTVFRLYDLFQDGSYGFTVVAYCGKTEAWSEKIDFKPPLSDCPKLNSANVWVNDWNPKGDTIGFEYNNRRQTYVPYLWRYREAGTVNWLDTLTSTERRPIIKLTFPKQNRSYEIQIKPVSSAACKDNWSDSKMYFVKCLKPILVSRKVDGIIAEFESNKVNSLYRWRYRLVGESEWKYISTGSEHKLTLSDLSPNSNYELQVQTQCDENEWGDYYMTSFSTKPCFYDSLKISHDFIYPDHVRLKTNLPQEEILSGRPKFNWSIVNPYQWNGTTPSKDTCRFFIAPNGKVHQFTLQYTCDNLTPENSKVYNYQVQLLPCVVPSASDIVVHEISSQAIKASVYRNKALEVAQIGYRKVGTQNLTVVKLSSNSEIGTLPNLTPNTTYELFARILCDPQSEGYSNWSAIKNVTTRKYGLVGDFLATVENDQSDPVQQLRLIPNPTQGQFNLELPKTIEGLAEISITNLNGQRIYNAQVQISPGTTFPLDLSQQPQGVYLVHLRISNRLYQEKLVLIR